MKTTSALKQAMHDLKLAAEQKSLQAFGEENRRLNAEIDAKKKRDPRDAKGDSKYARKRAYCIAHGVWGWQVPEPKPWKSSL